MTAAKKIEQASREISLEDLPPSEQPSSPGDASRSMTPKDVSPDHATWADRTDRNLTRRSAASHDEAMLDEAVEETFPASDPVACEPSATEAQVVSAEDCDEELLDEAVELTFPASDPIAVSSITRT